MKVRILKLCNIRGVFHAGETCEVPWASYVAHHALGNVEAIDSADAELIRTLSAAASEPARRAYEEMRAQRAHEVEQAKSVVMRRHYSRRRF